MASGAGTAWLSPLPALFAGVLLIVVGFWEMNQATAFGQILRNPKQWSAMDVRTRMIVGNSVGIPCGLLILWLAHGTSWQWMMWGIALVVMVGLGWSVPRRPIQMRVELRKALARLTPSLISHLRIGLSTGDPPLALLRSYLAIPDHRLRPMQQVVEEALMIVNQQRVLPFAALATVAEAYGCEPLIDVTSLLRQSEQEGSSPLDALNRLQEAVDRMLYENFRLMLERRKMYLLGVSAVAVLAVVGQILFVAIMGSGALDFVGR